MPTILLSIKLTIIMRIEKTTNIKNPVYLKTESTYE